MKRIIPVIFVLLISISLYGQVNVTYEASGEAILNPERGFYTQFNSQAEQSPLVLSALQNIRNSKKQTLILRLYYLKTFLNRDLSAKELSIIQNDFAVIRQAGLKCILRFAYSENIGQPDAPLEIVLRHLEQLKPIIQANADVIAVMQAGFIGAWGEWHSSTNNLDTVTARRAIVNKILEVLPPERMVQLRTPNFKREIFSRQTPLDSAEAFSMTAYSRTGHHNDCFLANYNDFGTYIDTAAEKRYLGNDALYTPVGGETCSPSSFSECANSLKEMRRLHWSYLNSTYHPTVLSNWATHGCKTEIDNSLGYRFELLDGTYSDSVKTGNGLTFNLRLRNIGFASLFNPRDVEIILTDQQDSNKYYVKLPVDARFWQPGDTIEITATVGVPSDMPTGKYSYYLNLPDPAPALHFRSEYSVRMANKNLWDNARGYNYLMAQVDINSVSGGTEYTDTLYFKPLEIPVSVRSSTERPMKPGIYIRNYPNPFNASTIIEYSLDQNENIKIVLYNALGQEVRTLADEFQIRGKHTLELNAASLPSGVYYCVLSASGRNVSGKLLLLK